MSSTDILVEETRDHTDNIVILEEDLISNSGGLNEENNTLENIQDNPKEDGFDFVVDENELVPEEPLHEVVHDEEVEDDVEDGVVEGAVTVMNVNGEEGMPKDVIVSKVVKPTETQKTVNEEDEKVKRPADFPAYEEIRKAKDMENEDPRATYVRDPEVVKSGEPDEDDWARKHSKSGKKVNDLIARFNNGAVFHGEKDNNRSAYKSDYGVGKGQGHIRQSVFQ
ncbi:Hypothetical protein SRAE_2000336700 [Strongyloides ratti]|uniref:Uncharacterized protein n=1 Tax=Strongyloides ratti TaxID=34506 RepID=A0A090LG49_STRRB|nr:Hypothetical protein SRAE_2000336700 [Strongyloides ratti]CEF68712.1 Hypothetical protein SRAE_2000336700 [Strongyloides ratti]